MASDLGETGPFSQGVQAGRKALRIHHTNGMEVCKKRSRGFKKEAQGVQALEPPEPPIFFSLLSTGSRATRQPPGGNPAAY